MRDWCHWSEQTAILPKWWSFRTYEIYLHMYDCILYTRCLTMGKVEMLCLISASMDPAVQKKLPLEGLGQTILN